MDENSILKKAAEVFVDKPDHIEITVIPKNKIDKFLQKIGLKKPVVKQFRLRKLLVGNRMRVASKAVTFPEDVFNEGMLKGIFKLSVSHGEDMLYIAAVALQNDREEPSAELIDMLKWLDDETFTDILDKALSQIDLQNFIRSTTLIMGTEMLKRPKETKMGPNGQRETIAPGEE